MNELTRQVRKAARSRGFDMIHYAPWENLFKAFQIDLIFDVGANMGQTYDSFRWGGFNGPIWSFEPNPETFRILEHRSGFSWQRRQYAISNQAGQFKFYITEDHKACGLQLPLNGQSSVVKEIDVPAMRLDEFCRKEGFTAKNIFLKVDAEGHDLEVIKGAAGTMDRFPLIMAEVSPVPRYQDESPLHEFVNFINQLGYRLCRADKNCLSRAAGIDTALDIVFAKTELLVKIGY